MVWFMAPFPFSFGYALLLGFVHHLFVFIRCLYTLIQKPKYEAHGILPAIGYFGPHHT